MLKLFQLNENELIKNSIYIEKKKENKYFQFIYLFWYDEDGGGGKC